MEVDERMAGGLASPSSMSPRVEGFAGIPTHLQPVGGGQAPLPAEYLRGGAEAKADMPCGCGGAGRAECWRDVRAEVMAAIAAERAAARRRENWLLVAAALALAALCACWLYYGNLQ